MTHHVVINAIGQRGHYGFRSFRIRAEQSNDLKDYFLNYEENYGHFEKLFEMTHQGS